MHTFRTWFTPGSVVAAAIVTLFWLHRITLSPTTHELLQVTLICLVFTGLWALTRDQLAGG